MRCALKITHKMSYKYIQIFIKIKLSHLYSKTTVMEYFS